MSLLKYINIPIFIISLAFGLFAVYVTMPDSRIIHVYPTPDNIEAMQYKDKTNTCFTIKETEVQCPRNEHEIYTVPPQA